ncbi:MAG: transposase [Verrucomicrobia bacterium]|nr:transposase [Verrucomicrobiota bacterium]
MQVPWAEPYGRFTKRFERLAIDLLQECSIRAVCEGLRISWDEADGIKQRAVARGLLRKQTQPVRRLGVDEKSAGRGQNYVTVVANLEPGRSATVEYVGDGRTQETLEAYWQGRSRNIGRRWRRWRWTCGRRTSKRRCNTCPRRPVRSSTTPIT